jgi:hypothetical protein
MRCPESGIVGRRVGVDGLAGSKANVLLRIRLEDGRELQELLTGGRPEIVVPERTRSMDVALRYAGLGVSHLLGGWDHMLFVLCLMLLVSSLRTLVVTITAFTLGHALTLSLATLGWVEVHRGWVELLIAFSIVVLAAELAAGRAGTAETPRRSLFRRYPWAMALGFGLLHGLGFASVLAEIGLPQPEIPLVLFAFNVGIEAGQLLFVLLVLGIAAVTSTLVSGMRSRRASEDVWRSFATSISRRRSVAYAIGTLAAYWCVGQAWMLR